MPGSKRSLWLIPLTLLKKHLVEEDRPLLSPGSAVRDSSVPSGIKEAKKPEVKSQAQEDQEEVNDDNWA